MEILNKSIGGNKMELAHCTEQEFFDAYCKAHEEKYGEEFSV